MARGLSNYIDALADNAMSNALTEAMPIGVSWLSPYPDFLSCGFILLLSCEYYFSLTVRRFPSHAGIPYLRARHQPHVLSRLEITATMTNKVTRRVFLILCLSSLLLAVQTVDIRHFTVDESNAALFNRLS